MCRISKSFLLTLCLAVALGVSFAAAADDASVVAVSAVETELPAGATTDDSVAASDAQQQAAPDAEAAEASATACASIGLESVPAFGVGNQVFLGEVCVGYCKNNSDCDAYCGPGDGGCDLNPANPCYRQCLCF